MVSISRPPKLFTRLLTIAFGVRLLVPQTFWCDIADSAATPVSKTSPRHHEDGTSCGGHAAAEEEQDPAEPANHSCHGDDETCACGLRFVVVKPADIDLNPTEAGRSSLHPLDFLIEPMVFDSWVSTRIGRDPPHLPRSAPNSPPNSSRAPPRLC